MYFLKRKKERKEINLLFRLCRKEYLHRNYFSEKLNAESHLKNQLVHSARNAINNVIQILFRPYVNLIPMQKFFEPNEDNYQVEAKTL